MDDSRLLVADKILKINIFFHPKLNDVSEITCKQSRIAQSNTVLSQVFVNAIFGISVHVPLVYGPLLSLSVERKSTHGGVMRSSCMRSSKRLCFMIVDATHCSADHLFDIGQVTRLRDQPMYRRILLRWTDHRYLTLKKRACLVCQTGIFLFQVHAIHLKWPCISL